VVSALRQLLRLVREYPREPLVAAVREAARYGLYDLDRLERMILRRVQRDFFLLDEELKKDPAMSEELEQLLKNLKLRRMLEIYEEQLRAAEKQGRHLLRVPHPAAACAVAPPPGDRLGISHPSRQPARALVAGNLSLRPPARG